MLTVCEEMRSYSCSDVLFDRMVSGRPGQLSAARVNKTPIVIAYIAISIHESESKRLVQNRSGQDRRLHHRHGMHDCNRQNKRWAQGKPVQLNFDISTKDG